MPDSRSLPSATTGSRTWTITPTVGLWVPAGVMHSGRMSAGTWYRAAQFGPHAAPPAGAGAGGRRDHAAPQP